MAENENPVEATKAKAAEKKAAKEAAAEAAAVEAAAKAVTDQAAIGVAKVKEPKLRRKGGAKSGRRGALVDSDIPYPMEHHGEDFEEYGPSGFASLIPEGTEIAPYSEDQLFVVDEEKLKTFKFAQPGRNLPKAARLYTIKGIQKDGRIIQIPFEGQINNTAGGDPEDAIGLRRAQRKGILVLINWETMQPLYCAAFECWAQAETNGMFPGFCSQRHAIFTLPNKYKDSGEILNQMFGDRATTTSTWKV